MTLTNDSSHIIIFILIGICLSLIALMTAIGNIIVLLAFYYDKKLRTTNDYFILNMAIADFLVGSFCIPFYIPYSIKQSWPFGRLFCKIWVTVDDVATMASVINIVAISINRYWSIAYPISYRKYAKQHIVYIVMTAVWCLSFLNFAPGIWLIGLFDKSEQNRSDCSGDYNHSFVYMLIAQFNYFIWPFIVLCALNLLIMLNIWRRRRRMSHLRTFHLPKPNRQTSNISPKFPLETKTDLFPKKSYQSQIIDEDNSLLLVNPFSLPNSPEAITYLSPVFETQVIQTKRQSIKRVNHFNTSVKTPNRKPKKNRYSSPAVFSSKKSPNVNSRVSRNYRSDSVVAYNISPEIPVVKPMNERIKENVRVIGRDSRINRDRKAARSLFILVFVFLIFLFPYVICATASTAGFHIPAMIFEVSFWLLWLNSTCNPFLYPFIQIKYRRAYAKLFQSCFKHFHFRRSN